MNDKITEIKAQVVEKLDEHFGLNYPDGTYYYCLTRCKSAFNVGTMTFDDFHEIDEEFTAELADLFIEMAKPLLQLVETQSEAPKYPIATGDDVTEGGWKLDYGFLQEIERRIGDSEFQEDKPLMEQIELSLLFAQELLKESI